MMSEEEIQDRMHESFSVAAPMFGSKINYEDAMEAFTAVTFGTALGWALGMTEVEIQDYAVEVAKFVHRENPEQLKNFLGAS